MRWVGFDPQSKGHRIYWPERHTVTVERNVRFTAPNLPAPFADDDADLEGEEEAVDDKSASPEPAPAVTDPSPVPPVVLLPPAPSGCPTRTRTPLQRVRDILEGKAADRKLPRGVRIQEATVNDVRGIRTQEAVEEVAVEDLLAEEISGATMATAQALEEGLDPLSLAEAKRHPEWPRWEQAMREELAALEKHGTWRLERPPPGTNIVSSKWVFHAKKDAAGNVSSYRT